VGQKPQERASRFGSPSPIPDYSKPAVPRFAMCARPRPPAPTPRFQCCASARAGNHAPVCILRRLSPSAFTEGYCGFTKGYCGQVGGVHISRRRAAGAERARRNSRYTPAPRARARPRRSGARRRCAPPPPAPPSARRLRRRPPGLSARPHHAETPLPTGHALVLVGTQVPLERRKHAPPQGARRSATRPSPRRSAGSRRPTCASGSRGITFRSHRCVPAAGERRRRTARVQHTARRAARRSGAA
jgi:hypothetical protein